VLNGGAMRSVAGYFGPAIWSFSTSGFHRFLATKPVSSETRKAERGQIWRPWFYWGLVAHGARSTQRLTYQLKLALEPKCLENLTATAREDPQVIHRGVFRVRRLPACRIGLGPTCIDVTRR
jgi:hypothetical protein